MEKVVCYSIIIWMCIVLLFICSQYNESTSDFYNIGPNNKLIILGFSINNYSKYLLIVIYCLLNSVMRSLTHNILSPWQTNIVQGKGRIKSKTIYGWICNNNI